MLSPGFSYKKRPPPRQLLGGRYFFCWAPVTAASGVVTLGFRCQLPRDHLAAPPTLEHQVRASQSAPAPELRRGPRTSVFFVAKRGEICCSPTNAIPVFVEYLVAAFFAIARQRFLTPLWMFPFLACINFCIAPRKNCSFRVSVGEFSFRVNHLLKVFGRDGPGSFAAGMMRGHATDSERAEFQKKVENMKDREAIRSLRKYMLGLMPDILEVMVDSRDEIMVARLRKESLRSGGGKKVVAVVGMAHMDGIEERLGRAASQ